MTTVMDIDDGKNNLATLLHLAKQGHEVLISDGDLPIARLTAVEPTSNPLLPRLAGLHQGAILPSDDFDDELPDEFWTGNA